MSEFFVILNKIFMWITDAARDSDGTLSISRILKILAVGGAVYAFVIYVKTDPFTALITAIATALGQAPISALASKIGASTKE